MWTYDLILQALGWIILISGFPLIFIYVRKITRHFSYLLFPRDMLIQYISEDDEVESYLLKQSIIRKKRLIRLTQKQAESLGGSL
ncbi:hypothetical protein C6Y56_12995 [Pseudomonas fluorescens]|uniref:Uncharacterized protein n=1 Tax=Pseudomonas fluorescens TaxID=294 RepID=A0A5E6U9M1_PSEFL|nr:hypothetical protein C6Y56_12995 [Pseudomonas fluorescens]VVN00004.1 hypothetical protein PS624_03279 [Pseudomonas fluorescens]